jgi:2,4'-dihydroxyacetophenone dioxygenase
MTALEFDERNTKWSAIEVPDYGLWSGFEFSPLAGSSDFKVVDFLIKFPPKQEANGKVTNLVAMHRHRGITHTFVIAGEHHIYEPDGTLREARPVGSITLGKPGDIHQECGGPDGAVVHYSTRGAGMLFEVLDDRGNVLGGLTLENLVAACGGA